MPFFRHLVQKALDNRQVACGLFAQSDEKIADAIQALDLISASLKIDFRDSIGGGLPIDNNKVRLYNNTINNSPIGLLVGKAA